jgi:hypothetical protein
LDYGEGNNRAVQKNYIMRSFIFDPFKFYYNFQIREDKEETEEE